MADVVYPLSTRHVKAAEDAAAPDGLRLPSLWERRKVSAVAPASC